MSPPTDDAALIWDDRHRRPPLRSRSAPPPRRVAVSQAEEQAAAPPPASQAEDLAAAGRITLRDAADRYGVSLSTLRNWSRTGQVDGVLVEGPSGRRWMVVPSTVAERVATGRAGSASPSEAATRGMETGAMLVPRAAWDKLMDQLGNLHEAGQQLAEARERAARYETEASFLRERLGELRAERDALRARVGETEPGPGPGPAWSHRLLRWWRGRPH